VATAHEIPLERRTLHGHFSRDLEPVLTVEPGDSVSFSVPNAGWDLESGERFEPREARLDDGHALIGPIEVRGARAGQTLVVTIEEVRVGSWGITPTDDEHAVRWELDADGGTGRALSREIDLHPFLGVIGMPPPEAGVHSTGPPRPSGGNIDCSELLAGTTLFLPIPVDGALVSAGDGHARQGDGEICGCAIECPVEAARLTLHVRDDFPLEWPVARIDGAWMTFGFDAHLGRAARIASGGMIDLMEREHGLDRRDALALASVLVDLRITQVVNQVLGVHAVLRDDAWR
jgi:acetamidase/formamidase